MSASFYDLQKYAATGQASPEMTHYDKMRALSMAGGKIKTLTGVPPLSFRANGKPLISLSMLGNGQQGASDPDFCGTRTGNLWNPNAENAIVPNSNLPASTNDWRMYEGNAQVFRIKCNASTTYTLSIRDTSAIFRVAYTNSIDIPSLDPLYNVPTSTAVKTTNERTCTFTTDSGTQYILLQVSLLDNEMAAQSLIVNEGSSEIPYEPYGYKIPITCGGQTTPIYIGDPLRKALDGSGAVDVLSSTGTITREVDADGNALATPITQAVDVPEIPTVNGSNTLTVDTDLQPSEMAITYTR